MASNKTGRVYLIFATIIVVIGATVTLAGLVKDSALLGLLTGAFSSAFNYCLLTVFIKTLMAGKVFMAIQAYVLRLLIYMGSIYVCVKLGTAATVLYSCGIIGIALALFIVYGLEEITKKQ